MHRTVFLFVLLSISTGTLYSENITNWTAISSNGEKIYKLDLLNFKWSLDERWEQGKYYTVCISPSGRYLAIQRYFENGFRIVDYKTNKTENHRIDTDKTSINSFSWSPNEEFLTFSFASPNKSGKEEIDDIYLYNLKSNESKKIYSPARFMDYPSPPSWNGTSDKVYFINKDNIIVEFDIVKNVSREITKGQGAYWLSDSELLIRKKKKYYSYDLQSKKEKYLFKLGWWQYPPISLSPDKKIFLCWDTMPRRFGNLEQWYTVIKEFPSGKTLKVISNYGANQFSWFCAP